MSDVDDIIYYVKSLKKGFDKDEFKERIRNLAYIVDNEGLDNNDFHNLFKVWLNLSIPVTKWVSIGVTLVPRDQVEAKTVEYAIRWLLANYQNQTSFSRIAFVLDWLTAAMDNESIDLASLDSGYEIFYMLLTYELITPNAMKLVYNLTKPGNVTRRRVVELIEIAKKREAKKSKCRQIQVLLGLFKSYKPECVPESIPAFSVQFKKINPLLLSRFDRRQADRNAGSNEKMRLNWVNPINMVGKRKADPLVPNMEFANIGSRQYADKEYQKNHLDFIEPVSLLQYSLRTAMARPARLRALLCNDVGLTLLATAQGEDHAFLSHDLHLHLTTYFQPNSPYSYAEKRDFLRRLANFQRTVMRGIPVVTWFLAQYLPFWNERDFFPEILSLVEWVSAQSAAHVPYVLRPLGRAALRSDPLHYCAIVNALTNLYDNWAFESTRQRHHFTDGETAQHYGQLLNSLAKFLTNLCNHALQYDPEDMRVLHWGVWASERLARTQLRRALSPAAPATLALALPLLGVSAAALDKAALVMLLYKQIFSKLKKSSATTRKLEDQMWTLQAYTADIISCLWSETILSARNTGIVFSKLTPNVVEKLSKTVPNANGALGLRSHVAFAPYTYVQVEALDHKDTDNKLWFDTVIEPEFEHLSRFLKKAAPELRG